MRILLDNNVPTSIKPLLKDFEIKTAYQMGWAEWSNGKLLTAAVEASFDIFLTLDKNLQFQQPIAKFPIRIAVLTPKTQLESDLFAAVKAFLEMLDTLQPGTVRTFGSAS